MQKNNENLQVGNDDPCPVYTFHKNDNGVPQETLALNNTDKKYNPQAHLS